MSGNAKSPLWVSFVKQAGLPIGIVGAGILILGMILSLLLPTPVERAFDAACATREGVVKRVNDVEFCVKSIRVEIPVPRTFSDLCRAEGGASIRRTINHTTYFECWKRDIVKELGARHDYTLDR